MRGRRKNLPGVGLAEKRGYDSDEEQEPQPRFFSSRIELQSGLDLAAKRRRCKARLPAIFHPVGGFSGIFAELTLDETARNTALIQPQMFHATISVIETGFEQWFFHPHWCCGTPMASSC